MRSVFSQPVGRGFRGSGESRSTQPLTLFLREFPFPRDILLSLFDFEIFNVKFFQEIKFLKKVMWSQSCEYNHVGMGTNIVELIDAFIELLHHSLDNGTMGGYFEKTDQNRHT